MPSTSVMRDSEGKVIATFYDQYRIPVEGHEISGHMRNAVVAIEDRRFYEHEGVDWFGVMRAAVTNILAGEVEQGASTLTQQYVKNYTWLIAADSEEEQAAAIEQSYARKLSEITTAEDLTSKMSRDDILTNYLNLVTFGNGTYGIEAAARTYFNLSAVQLGVPQSALLAGIVQAPSAFNPYENPDAALQRRNLVLDAMVTYGKLTAEDAAKYKDEPLGILEKPNLPQKGCISSGDRGFYCAKALEDLAAQGVDEAALNYGGYDVTTALDPETHTAVVKSLKDHANPSEPGVAEVAAFVQPGKDSRYVKSLASSRNYGFGEFETTLPLASTNVGNGAGSVFKVFTAAVALDQGMGNQTMLDVPQTYEASGLGFGGNEGCPPGKYCVSNVGNYPARMSLTDALAHSPNTPFVALAERVGNSNIVDMAVKLGMRSYTHAAEGQTSIADSMRGSGSFTLGVTPVSVLELANVGATIASEGTWCKPQTVTKFTKPGGEMVTVTTECEGVLKKDVAINLARALDKDSTTGTAATAARNTGWRGDMAGKTGTTDAHQSASFLGFTNGASMSVYAFNDGENTKGICTAPLRQCDEGNVYGGNEPAHTWFNAMLPVIGKYGGPALVAPTPSADVGTAQTDADRLVAGKNENDARSALQAAGFKVAGVEEVYHDTVPAGEIINTRFLGQPSRDTEIMLRKSFGPQPRAEDYVILDEGASSGNEWGSPYGDGRSVTPRQSNGYFRDQGRSATL